MTRHKNKHLKERKIIRMFYVTNFMTSGGGAGGNFFTNLRTGFEGFFKNGLGGDGAQAFGIAILVIGFVFAAISFAVHKFNPQSKLPGWVTCLVISVAGSILMGGVDGPMKLFEWARDTLYGWLGIGGGA